jgi:L-threonylcarbamoyladenylate synthase
MFWVMKTEILHIDRANPDRGAIARATAAVERGGLVIFPTETVYGIACRADRSAIARLDSIKQRAPQKSYSLHIPDKSVLPDYVPTRILPVRKLIDRLWPGPLTVVFDLSPEDMALQAGRLSPEQMCLYTGSSIGVRCPDDPVAAALLSAAGCPVVAPSANLSGQPPAITGTEAIAQFDGQVDFIIDAGPCKYSQSSTVVRIWSKGLEMLRQGFYTEQEIHNAMTVTVLFVCSGNTCRSPIAEGLCRKYLAEKLRCDVDRLSQFGYKILSAGTGTIPGFEASPWSVEFCASLGVDISPHRSTRLLEEHVRQADFVFAMSRQHCQRICAMWPEAADDKCQLLAWDTEVPDPIGGSKELYETCGRLIQAAVQKRVSEQLI